MNSHNREIISRIFSEEDLKKAFDKCVRYLAAYRIVEGNLGLFDKMARCRDYNDFVSAIYEAMRVKDRVLSKLIEGVEKNQYELIFRIEGDLRKVFDIGQEDVEKIFKSALENPRVVGTVLASLALAYSGIRVKG